jgi:catalase
VQYHFKTEQGIQNLTRDEATRLKGEDSDHATRDLYDAIERGEFPSWKLEMQIMTPEQAAKYRFDPFDITKVWFHGDVPPITIGRMVLNRNSTNYFAEVEQAAFSPANFVPGIAASPDKLLQGRLFSYHDTHRHRLGPNYHLIPINRPKAATVDNYQRDGSMQVDGNFGGSPNYYPNSFGGPQPNPDASDPAFGVSGEVARQPYAHPNDDFFQAGELYRRVMTDSDRDHLIGNITTHLCNAQKRIQLRQAAIFYKADAEYGHRIAEGLGLDIKEVERLAAMSQEERAKATAQ